MSSLTRHPLSALWGDVSTDEMKELVEDIKANGLLNPTIWVLNGTEVIDGWHRYIARNVASLTANLASIQVQEYQGDDPVGFVISLNARRRQLTPSQRAAAVVAARQWVGAESTADAPVATVREMAEDAQTSERTIQYAKAADAAGLGEQVRSGEISAKTGAEMATRAAEPPNEPAAVAETEATGSDGGEEAGPALGGWAETQIDKANEYAQTITEPVLAGEIEELKARIAFLEGEQRPTPAREAMFNSLRQQILVLRSDYATCQRQVKFLQSEIAPDATRQAMYNGLQARISTLQSSVYEWQSRAEAKA